METHIYWVIGAFVHFVPTLFSSHQSKMPLLIYPMNWTEGLNSPDLVIALFLLVLTTFCFVAAAALVINSSLMANVGDHPVPLTYTPVTDDQSKR
jgi:hypothetical protein